MKNLLRYLITFTAGALIALLIVCCKDIFHQTETATVMRILCDAFFVPGALIACVGLLVVATNGGIFDIIVYGLFISLVDALRRDVTKRKYKDFYEYRKAQKEKKRSTLYFFVVGLAFIAAAIVFLILFYKL